MKKLIIRIVSTLLMLGSGLSVADDNVELQAFAERFIEAEKQAWVNGNYTLLEAVEAEDVLYHGLGIDSLEAHKQYIKAGREGINNIDFNMQYVTGDGNLFAIDYQAIGYTDAGNIKTTALMLFRVTGGKISDVWMHFTSGPMQE